jgi:hypothetical protein
LPALAHRYPCDFTFYVADPVSSIHEQERDNFLRLTHPPLRGFAGDTPAATHGAVSDAGYSDY